MRIVVTGSEGFIGKHLCERLRIEGHEVFGIDIVNDKDAVDFDNYDHKPDVVIHLAAQTSVRASIEEPVIDAYDNILTTIIAAKCAKKAGAKRFIFASSGGAVYREGWSLTEAAPTEPKSPYGLSKLTCEKYLQMICGDMDLVILRLSNVYGPGQVSGVIPHFAEAIRKGSRPTIYGDGEQTRDFIHVFDVCNVFVRAMDGAVGVYNIGTGIETSVNKLLSLMGGKNPVMESPKLGELKTNSLDATKARKELSWYAAVSLEQGLAHL